MTVPRQKISGFGVPVSPGTDGKERSLSMPFVRQTELMTDEAKGQTKSDSPKADKG